LGWGEEKKLFASKLSVVKCEEMLKFLMLEANLRTCFNGLPTSVNKIYEFANFFGEKNFLKCGFLM